MVASQALGVSAIALLAALGILGANVLHDRGVDASISRRIAAILGGGAYFIAVLCLEFWAAVVVSGAIAVLVLMLRIGFSHQLRGLSRPGSVQRWGEVAYPLAGTASLAVGWAVLGDRWLAFVPIAFMAWGDNTAGVVRALIPRGREPGIWPSAAMLAVCLAVAALYQPYWVGAVGAVAAAAAERFHPTTHPLWDDNWVIVATSLSAMGALGTTVL